MGWSGACLRTSTSRRLTPASAAALLSICSNISGSMKCEQEQVAR